MGILNEKKLTTFIFMHLPKTSGKALRNDLKKESPKRCIDGVKFIKRNIPISTGKIISNHLWYGFHSNCIGEYSYISLMRYPIVRLYKFVREYFNI